MAEGNVSPRMNAIGLILMLLALPLFAVGCQLFKREEGVVIPRGENARDQSRIALEQVEVARRTIDADLRREEVRKAIAALDEVVRRYPEDREFTPAAHVEKARLQFSNDDYVGAAATYREVIRLYPEVVDVHATALYGLGQTLERLERFRESKQVYKQLIDTYENTANPSISRDVELARRHYRRIN